MAIDLQQMFDDAFAKSSGRDDEQIKGYEAAQIAEQAALGNEVKQQDAKLQAERRQAWQNADTSRRMAENNIPKMLMAQGTAGGMSETTAAHVFNNYLKVKTAAENTYSKANSDLQGNYTTNNANMATRYAQMLGEAREKQRDNAWTKAQWAYRMKAEEEERKRQEEERARAEAASRAAASGSSSRRGKRGQKNTVYSTGMYGETATTRNPDVAAQWRKQGRKVKES